jgi:hypothetical protein
MDFERIQQIASTIKVKRAGSQQQRRRRDGHPCQRPGCMSEVHH